MSNTKILNNVRLIQKCILVNPTGQVLALRRAADDHSRGGNWDLPGGGYEQGELVIDAIKREVMEEVGIVVKSVIPVFFANNGAKTGFFQGDNVFGICYFSRQWRGEVVLSAEHKEYQWISPQDFMKLDFGADCGFFVASMSSFTTLSCLV